MTLIKFPISLKKMRVESRLSKGSTILCKPRQIAKGPRSGSRLRVLQIISLTLKSRRLNTQFATPAENSNFQAFSAMIPLELTKNVSHGIRIGTYSIIGPSFPLEPKISPSTVIMNKWVIIRQSPWRSVTILLKMPYIGMIPRISVLVCLTAATLIPS